MRSKIVLGFLVVAVWSGLGACGGTTRTEEENNEPNRKGKTVESKKKYENDWAPSLSEDGLKMAFLSGYDSADPTKTENNTYIAYKYDASVATPVVSKASSSVSGEHTEAVISPDGNWIAIVAVESGKTPQLYIQSFSDSSLSVRVAGSEVSADDVTRIFPAFSPDASPLLAYERWNADGTGSLEMVSFSSDGSSITLGTPVTVPDLVTSGSRVLESRPRWNRVSSGYELITRVKANPDPYFIRRTFTDLNLTQVGTTNSGEGAIDRLLEDVSFSVGSAGLVFTSSNAYASRRINPLGDMSPSDVDPVIYEVFVQEDVRLLSLADNNTVTTVIGLPFFSVHSISPALDDAMVLVTGVSAFACGYQRSESELVARQGYGSSMSLYNAGTAVESRLHITIDDNGNRALSSDYCAAFNREDPSSGDWSEVNQPVDLEIRGAVLGDASAAGVYPVLFQSWHSGQDEIIYLTFSLDSEQAPTSPTFVNLSKKLRAATFR